MALHRRLRTLALLLFDLSCCHLTAVSGETSTWNATGQLSKLWATPVLEYRGLFSEEELKTLADDVEGLYADFLEEFKDPSKRKLWDDELEKPVPTSELTDVFFTFQVEHPMSDYTLKTVEKAFLIACEDYVKETGLPPLEELREEGDYTDPVFCWAAVHSGGMSHNLHTHPNAVLAGTIYLHVPPDGGNLHLMDPRGNTPPFMRTVNVEPENGMLVLFPGTLAHRVESTFGEKLRVSISCNYAGDWDEFTQHLIVSDERTWNRQMGRGEEAERENTVSKSRDRSEF